MNRPTHLVASSLLSSLVFVATAPTQGAPEGDDGPWRLQSLLGEDHWLKLRGEVRLRYEGIEGQYRSAARLAGSDHLVLQRTLLRADAVLDPATLTVEILDARHYGGGTGSALNTTTVNALDFLQASATLDLGELGSGEHRIRAGRSTIDIGSRRLMARNGYRNTINAFTGVDWSWENETSRAKAFWTMPVRRRPGDLASVLDNEIKLDDQDTELQFMGGYFAHDLDDEHTVEVYTLVLVEDQGRQRELFTPGVRVLRTPARGAFDYQWEAAFQFGDSRLSATGPDLDHNAWFQHASVGYTFDAAWSPRIRVAFDHASGDRDPGDGDNNRFDSLYGGRRFEYGPTSILGAIARSNLTSPDVRLELKPAKGLGVLLAWRGIWLASEQDTWTTAGVQDPTGQAGRHVGQQVETRFRWDLKEHGLRIETGAAHLFHGSFQSDAPGGQNTDTSYVYLQGRWQF